MGTIPTLTMEEEMLDATQAATRCNIVTMTNEHPEFYMLIGPFLSRREIVKELGGPIWDDDGMQWFVALSPDRTVLGFAAVEQRAGRMEFTNSYVLPEWRGQGIYRQLLAARLEACPAGTTIRALTTKKSVEPLLRRGFTVRRYRGQYAEVELTKKEG